MASKVNLIHSDIFDLELDTQPELVVTSPPYWNIDPFRYGGDPEKQINYTRNKSEFLDLLTKATQKIYDLLSDTGILVINIGMIEDVPFRYICDVLDKTDFHLVQTLIWDVGETVSKMEQLVNTAHPWFVLAKTDNPFINPFTVKKQVGTVLRFPGGNHFIHDDSELSDIGFSQDAFPIELIEHLLNCFSKPRDTILDPFGGSGVMAIAALRTNRRAIINDISEVQLKMAQKRIELYLKNDSI